jgi:hypothetical protein|eukprot:6635940-Prymnesium_polylepis.2
MVRVRPDLQLQLDRLFGRPAVDKLLDNNTSARAHVGERATQHPHTGPQRFRCCKATPSHRGFGFSKVILAPVANMVSGVHIVDQCQQNIWP